MPPMTLQFIIVMVASAIYDERQRCCHIVKPCTILVWSRQLSARNYDSSEAGRGRPSKPQDVCELCLHDFAVFGERHLRYRASGPLQSGCFHQGLVDNWSRSMWGLTSEEGTSGKVVRGSRLGKTFNFYYREASAAKSFSHPIERYPPDSSPGTSFLKHGSTDQTPRQTRLAAHDRR